MGIEQYGYRLTPSKPNEQGLCTFTLIDSDGCEAANIDRPCTLEEAMSAAWRYITKELEDAENEN